MSEWAVVTVIVTLAGFVIAILSPIVKLNSTIIRINTTVGALEKNLEALRQDSTKGYDRIWESKKEQDEQLADLKTRLVLLEKEWK